MGGEREARHLFSFQNEFWYKAKYVFFLLTTMVKDLQEDRMGMVFQRVLNNKIFRVRRHEGYECL